MSVRKLVKFASNCYLLEYLWSNNKKYDCIISTMFNVLYCDATI